MLESRARVQRQPAGVRRYVAYFVLAALQAWGSPALAAPGDISKFTVNDENPSASIPSEDERNADPMQFGYFLQDLFTKAEHALEKKDWERSAKYYEALARVVPERAFAFSRLCQSYAGLGKLAIATANCSKALGLSGANLFDHKRYVELVLTQRSFSPGDVAAMDASIAHVRAHVESEGPPKPVSPIPRPLPSSDDPNEKSRLYVQFKEAQAKRDEELANLKTRTAFLLEFELVACRLALRLRDVRRLDQCEARLKAQNAGEQLLLPFEWSRALIQRDQPRANALLAKASTLNIPGPTLHAMRVEQEKAFAPAGVLGLLKRYGLFALGLVIATLGVFVGMRRVRSADPTPAS